MLELVLYVGVPHYNVSDESVRDYEPALLQVLSRYEALSCFGDFC